MVSSAPGRDLAFARLDYTAARVRLVFELPCSAPKEVRQADACGKEMTIPRFHCFVGSNSRMRFRSASALVDLANAPFAILPSDQCV